MGAPFGLLGHALDGRYRVDAVVGEGGFGVVFRGHRLDFDVPIAIKCLKVPAHFTAAARELFLEKFRDEGRHLARLCRDHRSITNVFAFGTAAGVPYLVMEWLDGKDLEQILSERTAPFSEAEALAFIRPAVDALAFAHSLGVAHRDIKPANLLLADTARGQVLKVLDFGIAKAMSDGETATQVATRTSSGFSAFSPNYGAPEQFQSKKFGATGPWTDVHGLGLILVEMVTGIRALKGEEMVDFAFSCLSEERPSPRRLGASVSDAFEALCKRTLALSPKARFEDAGELLKALDELEERAAQRGQTVVLRAPVADARAPAVELTVLQAPARTAPEPLDTGTLVATTLHDEPRRAHTAPPAQRRPRRGSGAAAVRARRGRRPPTPRRARGGARPARWATTPRRPPRGRGRGRRRAPRARRAARAPDVRR
jgi:serine/threonine-protein kinase